MSGYDFAAVKALVVDDNVHMRELTRAMLRGLGIPDPREAADGDVALKIAAEAVPDLILTDLRMDPMDGIELVRRIRNPEAPYAYAGVIMMTAHSEYELICAARDAGTTEFLAKPISVQTLAGRITEIIERPRPFIRSKRYFGPDRRRRRDNASQSPRRRSTDGRVAGVAD